MGRWGSTLYCRCRRFLVRLTKIQFIYKVLRGGQKKETARIWPFGRCQGRGAYSVSGIRKGRRAITALGRLSHGRSETRWFPFAAAPMTKMLSVAVAGGCCWMGADTRAWRVMADSRVCGSWSPLVHI